MIAIKSLILGVGFDAVCAIYEISARTLTRWISAFNERGLDGLIDKPRCGRPRSIASQDMKRLTHYLEEPQTAGETHWTGRKFHGFLRKELELEVAYSTTMRYLAEQDYRLKIPQPWPDRQDEEERQAFLEKLLAFLACLETEIWFCDETGIEGDPRPRARFAKKGSKPRVTKNGDHLRLNVTGMICPRTGQGFFLEFSHTDGSTFQAFLNAANQDISLTRKQEIIILDNASWHKLKGLNWGRFLPIYLPPYSPDFNPIERLWRIMKAEWFTDFIAKTAETLVDRLDLALQWLIGDPERNMRTCAIKTTL